MARRLIFATLAAVTLAACGGGSDDAATTTAPAAESTVATTVATTADTAPTATAADTTPPPTAPPDTTSSDTTPAVTAAPATTPVDNTSVDTPPATGAVAVSLFEWEVDAPTSLPAGPTTFAVTNDGDFRHHFGVARGNSYEELPQLPSGAIDEDALGDDYLGRTDNIEFAESATIEFDLTPGNYVFFCNVIAGPTSHAARGQVLSVTVG